MWPTAALVVVVLASIAVITVSLLVSLPPTLVASAYLVFVVCALVVAVGAYRDARAAGTGFFRSIGRSLKEILSMLLS